MSTATNSFTTRLRTWVFVAGLTALLLTAGLQFSFLFGGQDEEDAGPSGCSAAAGRSRTRSRRWSAARRRRRWR